ncbi:aminotransferase class I/II-fold pyridoxal phosphate-dependent enzyme [Bradymonadaceae bacterium TMQ3]|uniref:Aminotransferase class I/II-fold pyridoxal phosphate-dependent enzyme n=1 Tax=Lujinxingia sediminis TaxID=2480984 RepID=A0ABY0CPL9_9DELT|nr:aminotransferase class I/II-fold pyridoxal phosphate-dependent enzyme [Lujinxingia sediminis]RDV36558.1 aminotransferase class I/II-fold pyridoxal phosphate-dependent enzyme [Bradymonadaceae bacterium TMQ3]RVU42409.1 aminotransferase class I/II-fold pyridoxal phosphate-dependent enzyme [Lujinxingia sediminis]TXC74608.1 aminotransferase class I/II-fold pyridoxal phosphate-dependent enzyme [Bradymonadales bacterium TMQ1]
MKPEDVLKFSLADFTYNDSDGVLNPPEDFDAWIQDPRVAMAMSFFEQPLHNSPKPRTELSGGHLGKRRPVINLTSYNYLGLSTHPEVVQAAAQALMHYGVGASGAAMLSGTFDQHVLLAQELAAFKGQDACMLFSSGYGGNLGAIQGLLQKGDVLVVDSKCHRSVVDGATLSGAKMVSFAHNDAASLDETLTRYAGKRRMVVVEGVYSMDGDVANLPALLDVCDAHDVPLYLDEAHSSLVYGETGRGLGEHFGVEDRIGVHFGTLSKAFGGVGGFVCGEASIMRYLKCYAASFQFSCALPPAIVAAMRKSLEVATRDNTLREQLWANVRHFRSNLIAMGLDIGESTSQVIPIIVGSSGEQLIELAMAAQERGLYLQPIDFPAVEAHSRRFRISVSAQLSAEDIDEASNIIEDVIARPLGLVGAA